MASPSFSTEGTIRPPLCAAAPVLRSLLPLAGGILAARYPHALHLVPILLLAAVFTFRGPRRLIPASFLTGFILAFSQTPRPHPSWENRPPREVQVSLEITETFNARKPGRLAGIGRVRESRLPLDTLRGHEVAFYLATLPDADTPARGHHVTCSGLLTHLPFLEELDDYQAYLTNRAVFLSLNQGRITAHLRSPPFLERLRQRLHEASAGMLRSGTREPGDPGNVLASMLLGERSFLTDDRIQLYRETGTYHLFAVSGLHVGSFALCLFGILALARLPRTLAVFPVLAGTWIYIWLTGASPSAIRAGIMISCLSLSRSLSRQPHPFPALALSAWIVLLRQPSQLFHLGFQLSYSVVGAILLLGLPAAAAFRNHLNSRAGHLLFQRGPGRRILQGTSRLFDLVAVSLSASLVSMPLIIQHFNLFTPAGVFFGILLNPLVTFIVMLGTLCLLAAPLLGTLLPGTLAVMSWPAITFVEFILKTSLRIPHAVSERAWSWPPAGTVLVLLTLLLAWILQRGRMTGARLPVALSLLPHGLILTALSLFLQQTDS
ncbi:MAG: ComEC/Rec2 family competence protein [Oceanipulchritudo sp.]